MNPRRSYAVMLRFLYLLRTHLDRWAEVLFFPVVDLFLWGMTSTFFASFFPVATGSGISGSQFILMTVTGIIFWLIMYRTQMEIPMNILEELWNKSLLNLFCSPLTFGEWVAAFLSLGLLKISISVGVSALLAFALYSINIFQYGLALVPFVALLLLCGWWLGFFVAGLILRFGTSFQAFAWTLGIILAPFSAIYYPASVLPAWAQTISAALPTSYIFEGMRQVVLTGTINRQLLLTSLALSSVYIALTMLFMRRQFKRRLERGLLSLE